MTSNKETKSKRVKVIYCSIQSDHIFAIPEEVKSEIVEYKNRKSLDEYIESKKDIYGNKYKKATKEDKEKFGFNYISSQGGVELESYKEPKIKTLD